MIEWRSVPVCMLDIPINQSAVNYEDALHWIAFRRWTLFEIGPRPLFMVLPSIYDNGEREFYQRDLAEDIFFNEASKGRIRCVGVVAEIIFHQDVGYERVELTRDSELISSEFFQECYWDYDINDEHWILRSGNRGYYGLAIVFEDLIKEYPEMRQETSGIKPDTGEAPKSAHTSEEGRKRRGRPRAYDMEEFYIRLVEIANTPDGLPVRKADLERMMLEWCQMNWNREPAESTIRKWLDPVYGSKAD